MLVWEALQGTQNVFTMSGAGLNSLFGESERYFFSPNKLSAAMIGAFKAVRGHRVANSVETSYAQWRQYMGCAVQGAARRSRAASTKLMVMRPIRAVCRMKAFFVSQKVDGRNAP